MINFRPFILQFGCNCDFRHVFDYVADIWTVNTYINDTHNRSMPMLKSYYMKYLSGIECVLNTHEFPQQ